jgi:hypothetical protein
LGRSALATATATLQENCPRGSTLPKLPRDRAPLHVRPGFSAISADHSGSSR